MPPGGPSSSLAQSRSSLLWPWQHRPRVYGFGLKVQGSGLKGENYRSRGSVDTGSEKRVALLLWNTAIVQIPPKS